MAWVPQGIPGSAGAAIADSSWLYGESGDFGLAMSGPDAQLAGQLSPASTPRLAFREAPIDQNAWVGDHFAVTNDAAMFGVNWMYWAVATTATVAALAAAGKGSGSGSHHAHHGGLGGKIFGDHAPTPAPEPSSLLIFGLGALLVGWSARRRLLGQAEPAQPKLD